MQNNYESVIENNQDKPQYLLNMFYAFLFGGSISLLGQFFIKLYEVLGMSKESSQTLMIITLIFLSAVLTGFGIYDKIGQKAKCGTIIPITGFANSMTCAAIEGRSEGIIQGIGVNLFKLAGCVIVFGVVSAFVVGGIKYIIWLI